MSFTSLSKMTFLGPRLAWTDFPKDVPTLVDTWRCLPFVAIFLLLRKLSDITLSPILVKMVEMSNASASRKARFGKNALKKSSEAGFHFVFHSCSFVGTLIVLWNKPWLWETKQCWVGWPKLQDIPSDVYWLYMVQLGYYVSQFISIIFLNDHQQKDKTLMVCHHLITMFLLVGSLAIQTHRIGTLVLLVHDMADPCVCMLKVLWATEWRKSAENVAVFGVLVWILSRQILFPYMIINSTMFESLEVSPAIGVDIGLWWFFNIFLVTLLLFHCWWTWQFVQIIVMKVTKGNVTKGSQQLDDTDASDEEDAPGSEVRDGDGGRPEKVKVN